MRWPIIAGAVLALGAAGSTQAEDGPFRRFTRPAIDPNRNDRAVYVPVLSTYSGTKSAELPHDVASAAWYAQSLGVRGAKPDKVLDGGKYTLDRFDVTTQNGAQRFEVVISRFPAPDPDKDVPLLRVVESASGISSAATPVTTPVPGGVQYRFSVQPPLQGFAAVGDQGREQRFILRFLPAQGVSLPPALRRAGTFDGASVETKMTQGPPQLTVAERVAGRRLEYRSTRSAGIVVFDQKVAGKRQELNRR